MAEHALKAAAREAAAHEVLERTRRQETEPCSWLAELRPLEHINQFSCEAGALLARHQLHEQCLAELVAVAESSPDAAASLPTLLRELGGWHDRLVRELVSLVNDCARDGELRVTQVDAQLRRAEGETASLRKEAERLEQRVRAAEDARAAALHVANVKVEVDNDGALRSIARMGAASSVWQERRAELTARAHDVTLEAARRQLRTERPRSAGSDVIAGEARFRPVSPLALALSSSQIASSTERMLTLKAMHEFIEELYASKSKYNARCAVDSRLKPETMEQHLYTHLNTKYGLRRLILEHVSACYDAVRRYSHNDNDVNVFGCILRNEVDEEFRLVQQQLKQTVRELLVAHLKGKMPLKGDAEISSLVQARTKGLLQEDEWKDIVLYMYAPGDAALLLAHVKEKAEERCDRTHMPASNGTIRAGRPPPAPTRRQGSSSAAVRITKLAYSDFLQVLLDFQLAGHKQFLKPFVAKFRSLDEKQKGVLTEANFRRLVASTVPEKSEADVEQLLLSLDPYDHQLVTFSDCVVALSKDLVAMLSAPTAEEDGQTARDSAM